MALPLVTDMPDPRFVMSADGFRIATYTWGDDGDPVVLCVHGFASSCRDNWVATGWVRALLDAGLRVLGVDLRGHGASEKPYEPDDFSMDLLVSDLENVLDTHLVEELSYLGYSLGARIGWHATVALPHLIRRAVLGGIPDGRPLGRLDLGAAHAFLDDGAEITDPDTLRYVRLAERVAGNDLRSLVALAEGMRFDDDDPDLGRPPEQPVLFAAGSDDPVLADTLRLSEATPSGSFVEVPGRHHVNAPGSRIFRAAGTAFLAG